MERFDYLVVGAGFAGAVCAERLASAGRTVLVVDQRSHVAGNAYDYYDEAGILVHKYGAHVFHTNSIEVIEYLSRFTAWRPYEHRVLSSVNGQLLPVPINQTTLEAFGGDEAAARVAMIEPYTRKQWGAYSDELAPTVLARIKTRTDREDRYFSDAFQAMPHEGYTRVIERMLDHPFISVRLNTSFRQIEAEYERPVTIEEARLRVATRPSVIYTGPIDQFFDYCYGRLPYRSAEFVFRHLPHVALHQSVGVVNYPSEAVGYTRVAEFKHLTGQRHSGTTIAEEYPRAKGEPFWPVPTPASAALYKRYAERAASMRRIHFCGRLGTFQYYDIHQVVGQALKLASTLLTGAPHANAIAQ